MREVSERSIDDSKILPAADQAKRAAREALSKAGVPPRFMSAEAGQIPPVVWGKCAGFISGADRGLYLYGPTGTGKTYTSTAVGRARLEARWNPDADGCWTAAFITAPKMLMELRSTFGSSRTAEEIIKRYSNVSLLLLDDIGAERQSAFALEVLSLLIDLRYGWQRETVITSNFSLGELGEKSGDLAEKAGDRDLAKMAGDRIASRIAEMCRVIYVDGPDRRLSR